MSLVERADPWTVAGLGGWLGYQLLVQHGRLLLRIEALEERLAELTGASAPGELTSRGLPMGSVVLDFALPTLGGPIMTLAVAGAAGPAALLRPAVRLLSGDGARPGRLGPDPADGRPVPLVVSAGDPGGEPSVDGSPRRPLPRCSRSATRWPASAGWTGRRWATCSTSRGPPPARWRSARRPSWTWPPRAR